MSQTTTGGCACGKVRYVSGGEIEMSFHCHCRKCQLATGGGHSSAFVLLEKDVRLSGEIRYYEQKADTGYATHSGFCPECGSPILCTTARFPDRLYIHVATLDDPSTFEPAFVVFEEVAQPWDRIDPALLDAG